MATLNITLLGVVYHLQKLETVTDGHPYIRNVTWGPLAQSVERRASGREIRGSGLSRVGGGFHMYS